MYALMTLSITQLITRQMTASFGLLSPGHHKAYHTSEQYVKTLRLTSREMLRLQRHGNVCLQFLKGLSSQYVK